MFLAVIAAFLIAVVLFIIILGFIVASAKGEEKYAEIDKAYDMK